MFIGWFHWLAGVGGGLRIAAVGVDSVDCPCLINRLISHKIAFITNFYTYKSLMNTLQELGEAVAKRRRQLKLSQGQVAQAAGVNPSVLSRLERGRASEYGARKLLQVLAVLGLEVDFRERGQAGSLEELKREREQRKT